MNGVQNNHFKNHVESAETEDKIKSFEEIKMEKLTNI